MSNETKIGILAIVTIALFIYGFKFIKGQNILTTSTLLYVDYENVDQLSVSSPILVNGFQVGVVSNMYLNPDNMNSIIVVLDIESSISIHKNAVAEIVDASIMGGKAVRIVENTPCSKPDCANSGDYINGRTLNMLEAMVPKGDLEKYLTIVKDNIGPAFDSINSQLKDPDEDNLIGMTMQDLQASLANLKSTTDQFNRMMASSSGSFTRTVSNLESITDNVKASNEQISSLLANVDAFSSQLKDADIGGTINTANKTLGSTDEAIVQLKATLEKADAALAELGTVAKRLNEGEGTLPMLLNDKAFAQKLSQTIHSLDTLITDIQAYPYNYIPLKSRRKVNKWRAKDAKEGQ